MIDRLFTRANGSQMLRPVIKKEGEIAFVKFPDRGGMVLFLSRDRVLELSHDEWNIVRRSAAREEREYGPAIGPHDRRLARMVDELLADDD